MTGKKRNTKPAGAKTRLCAALALFVTAAAATLSTTGGAAAAAQKSKGSSEGGGISAQKGVRTVTLKVGQGVDFARGRASTKKEEAGLLFQYVAPGDTSSTTYNVGTQQLQYNVGIKITQALPRLTASHTARFPTRPQPNQFTSGDVFNWTDDDPVVAGAWYVVQSKLDDQHYLVHVTKAVLPTNKPGLWSLTLTYEPYAVRAGGAGGKNAPVLSGTLRLKNLYTDKLIIDFDMKTGRMKQVADGYYLHMNARGDMVYYDNSNTLLVSDKEGKRVGSMRVAGQSPSLSPDGKKIALVENRTKMMDAGFGKFNSQIALGHVVIRDVASGKELAVFPDKDNCNWTPDGRVVMSEYGGNGLYITDSALKNLTTLSADLKVGDIAPSPDGKLLAIDSGGRLWTLTMSGGDLKQIAITGRTQGLPAWSPDGKWIAFSEETASTHYDVRAVRVSDGNIVTLRTSDGASLYAQSRMFWRP